MSQPQGQQGQPEAAAGPPPGEPEAPEIVSEFPAPPAFFSLYRDGADAGPAPPQPMAPTYHMFGSPFSTQDVVPDLLPGDGRKLYAPGGEAEPAAANVDYKAEMKKWACVRCSWTERGAR
jgi:hypothetical protein